MASTHAGELRCCRNVLGYQGLVDSASKGCYLNYSRLQWLTLVLRRALLHRAGLVFQILLLAAMRTLARWEHLKRYHGSISYVAP